MPNVTDLLSTFYDVLLQHTHPSPGTYVQTGWPGIALSPADFKLPGQPNGPYDTTCAEETTACLANLAPTCNALAFEPSGYDVHDLYQILIAGAVPAGADPGNLLNNPNYKLFSDAQFEFANAQRGSIRDPNEFYYPCHAVPADWYTEQNAQGWTAISIASGDVKTAAPDSAFVKGGGKSLLDRGTVRVVPSGATAAILQAKLQSSVTARANLVNARFGPARVMVKPLEKRTATFSAPVAGAPRAVGTAKLDSTLLRTQLASVSVKNSLRPALSVGNVAGIASVDVARASVVPTAAVTINQRVFLQTLLARELTPRAITSQSSSFSMSFRFCLVNIARPWYNAALLNMKSWYMFGTRDGEYSTGTIDDNPGMFPLLPNAFIAIRDLKVTANWAQQDVQTVQQAKYFGPFDVRSASFQQNTLSAPGLQVVAWVSRLNPKLPPMKDPSLA
jgi:hypothetical protein